jgi:hypothetical protein
MLRQEKFGAGMSDQKDLDAQFAKAIMGDGKFEVDFPPYNILKPELNGLSRMTLTIWMTMRRNLAGRRCVQTP